MAARQRDPYACRMRCDPTAPALRIRFLAGLLALLLAACGPDLQLPPAPADAASAARQQAAFVAAMQPRRPGKPVVAVVALNESTETTDFLLTHAVLQRSGVADVQAVAPRRGRVALYPVLQVEVAQDLAGFDKAYPGGADYVVVPALDDAPAPAITAWLREQASKGARIIGVCVGVLNVGRAGLLDGRRFVTHWYSRGDALERHPSASYVPHQRYVVDGNVATTTGITASIPAMLALVEAMGGRERAQALAGELGVASWTPAHDSGAFGLNAGRASRYLLAKAAFWRDEDWRADVREGVDDIALALAADAWARTGYISVKAAAPGPVRMRSGLVLLAQPADEAMPRLPLSPGAKPVQQLDRTLCEIAARYGAARSEWVMMELEYPGGLSCGS